MIEVMFLAAFPFCLLLLLLIMRRSLVEAAAAAFLVAALEAVLFLGA
jgi:hypothetical protein